jgi:hypothetical protein
LAAALVRHHATAQALEVQIMRKSDVIKSKYFRAADMPSDWVLQAEIELARVEKFEGGKGKSGEAEKLVVYFLKQKSGLVCGPVLWDEMIAATGEEDTDLWPGTVIELATREVPWRTLSRTRSNCRSRPSPPVSRFTLDCLAARISGCTVRAPRVVRKSRQTPVRKVARTRCE